MSKRQAESKSNPVLWFLFAIVIPLTLVVSLTLFILNLSGVDVTGWTKDKLSHVPVISSFVTTTEEQHLEEKVEKSESKVAEQTSEIETLNLTIDDLEGQIKQLEDEILRLENKETNDLAFIEDAEAEEEQSKQKHKNMAASFKKMDKAKAAAIFEQLPDETAIKILGEMSNDVRGHVLEGMNPEKAAQLAEVFVK